MKHILRTLAVSLVSLAMANMAEARTYKIGSIQWIAFGPVNVAETQGLWKKLGVDVEVTVYGSNQELNTALENKKIDIAIDMIGSWVGMYMDGVPLTILAETDWSNGGDKIIAKPDVDFAKIKGQKLGVYLDKPSVTFFLSKFLGDKGVKLSDVQLVELEPQTMADNFIQGRLPVIVNYDPEALRAEREGKGIVAATSATYPGVIPEGFVARTDVVKEIPKDDLVKIMKGWVEAVKWVKDPANMAALKTVLNEKTFAGAKNSDDDIKGMLDSVKIHTADEQKARNAAGGGLETYLTELNAFLKANNLLKKDFTAKDILDTTAIVEALK